MPRRLPPREVNRCKWGRGVKTVVGAMPKDGLWIDPLEIKVIGPHDSITRDPSRSLEYLIRVNSKSAKRPIPLLGRLLAGSGGSGIKVSKDLGQGLDRSQCLLGTH
jgi:hypothetical protein